MVIKTAVATVIDYIYRSIRYSIDTVIYILIIAATVITMVLNAALSLLILSEEIIIAYLILPWTPTSRIGDIFYFLKRWGFPGSITLTLYIVFVLVFVTVNIIGLELHYLQVNENLQLSFEEFKNSLISSLKLFVVIHRFLHVLSNEAALRRTCSLLRKRLKFEQNEELDEKQLAEGLDDDLEVESLKYELEKAKSELEAMRLSYSRLQERLEKKVD
ncbi:uncharacterized protein LOC118200613 isoform X2 [Stegodyphus dumicola]|uniref:uncharacterized protein LOC118200613 isoform X2 n=1 Tax=Stegodyphus dumicola TaxID=202533 RepID=UPI0015B293D1|nr:uncharacterized protein LOC118200613 isoform X2 [Stegodyphus dumicola]